jgi:TonB family protein
MFRSLFISWGLHGLLFVILVTLSLIHPPAPPPKEIINVRMISAPPKPQATPAPQTTPAPTPRATPAPTARPTPRPTPAATPAPKEIAKATPKPEVKKPEEPKKKEIAKDTEIITPTPTPKAKETPKPEPTPKETPYRPEPTPRATAQPTPQSTPKATPPPINPEDIIKPNVPTVSGPIIATEMQERLGNAYYSIAVFQIQQNFKPPQTRPGITCDVQFRIMRNGEIRNIKVMRSTGHPDLDQAAVRALQVTARLPELYDTFPDEFIDVRVIFDFEKEL